MRAIKLIGILFLTFIAFTVGYALCGWRFNTQVVPALEESRYLHDADSSAQIAGIIDSGDFARAREKLLVRAFVGSKPLPSLGDISFQWKGIFTAPFENVDVMLQMLRGSDEGTKADLSHRLTELCAKSPDSKTTKYVCDR